MNADQLREGMRYHGRDHRVYVVDSVEEGEATGSIQEDGKHVGTFTARVPWLAKRCMRAVMPTA